MRELIEYEFDGHIVRNAGPENGAAARKGRRVTVNIAESPLSWLRARGMICARQCEAGERLRSDFETASLGARVTMKWDDAPVSRIRRGAPEPLNPIMAQVAAKRRFDDAVQAAGPGLNDVLWRVICAGEGLSHAEKALGWPARAGKLVLGMALDRLADHYRLR